MKFKVITIDNKGNGFKDAVEETKKVDRITISWLRIIY